MTLAQQPTTQSDNLENPALATADGQNHGMHPYAVRREPEIVTTLLAVPQNDPKAKGFRFNGAREFKRRMQPGETYVFRLVEGLCKDEAILSHVSNATIDVFFMMAGTQWSDEHKAQAFGLCGLGLDLWSAYVAVDYRRVRMVAMARDLYAKQVYDASIRSTVPQSVRDCIDFDALALQMHNAGEIHTFRWYGEDFVITNPQDFRN